MSKTLIIVDVQNDFSPSGALPVPDGDSVVAVINRLMPYFDHVIATQDWHPAGHGSFASVHHQSPGEIIELNGVEQILWPDHCVQSTWGAEFIPGLTTDKIEHIVYKGSHPDIDSYSGFFDNGKQQATGLNDYLNTIHPCELYIAGLATDYCVLFTALDAAALGFKTYVIQDACRAVNLNSGDEENALNQMAEAGCHLVCSADLLC
ncbi:bifunctional nicotinamidase/pyrazinamidase [Vibrio mangrovi]|uniref:Nicotinamidase n=1 Tax=Vibrio mangrovi TaxID=474394 RepID=A0A1Y6INV7_9VIBR|nr:bifunctional nicotinamidase/pyrazinamidase [Vibrio mangrovi]MDW6003888.1 bifunctional nicotinamidase/pyrazinamidase [Vibrio mangrovi]SMR99318.1 nicotinamidase/pyrazinamidase [Vibrio mangrovi]